MATILINKKPKVKTQNTRYKSQSNCQKALVSEGNMCKKVQQEKILRMCSLYVVLNCLQNACLYIILNGEDENFLRFLY